jgi:hypothetical protein
MKKKWLIFMFLAVFVVWAAPCWAEVRVEGGKARVDAVAAYLSAHLIQVKTAYGQEVTGKFKGKPWPGVLVTSDLKDPDGGIFVPVSDAALKKGLCSDQKELLTGFLKPVPPPVEKPKPAPKVDLPPQAYIPPKPAAAPPPSYSIHGSGCDGCVLADLMVPNQWEPGILTDYRIDAVFINDVGKGPCLIATKIWNGRVQMTFYNGTRDLQKLDSYYRFSEALNRAIELTKNKKQYPVRGLCAYKLHR